MTANFNPKLNFWKIIFYVFICTILVFVVAMFGTAFAPDILNTVDSGQAGFSVESINYIKIITGILRGVIYFSLYLLWPQLVNYIISRKSDVWDEAHCNEMRIGLMNRRLKVLLIVIFFEIMVVQALPKHLFNWVA